MPSVIAKGTYHIYNTKLKRTVTIFKGDSRDDKDPLVKAAPWAFQTPEEAMNPEPPTFGPAGSVETATAAPGEKRAVKKRTTKK